MPNQSLLQDKLLEILHTLSSCNDENKYVTLCGDAISCVKNGVNPLLKTVGDKSLNDILMTGIAKVRDPALNSKLRDMADLLYMYTHDHDCANFAKSPNDRLDGPLQSPVSLRFHRSKPDQREQSSGSNHACILQASPRLR